MTNSANDQALGTKFDIDKHLACGYQKHKKGAIGELVQ
jgi:hypothetical protein